jgi:prepilin-type N-terminal cleavage/methylation domain-containing protein
MTLRRDKGFSLIELVIVITIVGILAGIAIPQLSKYRTQAKNALALSDLKNAVIAQEAYYAENKVYAGSCDRLILSHNLVTSSGVDLEINGNESAYTITSNHFRGDKTYTYAGPGGDITSE